MKDATDKLSELLSAARGRRTLDDALGVVRREPSTKTLLSTANSRTYLSCNSFLKAADGSRSASDPDGGESPDLAASMRLVRSYAARVKQMPPSEPTPSAFPPYQPLQCNSFVIRSRGGSFRDRFLSLEEGGSFRDRGASFRSERLRRRQWLASPPMSRERSPEPSRSMQRAPYPSPERAPNVLFNAGSLPLRRASTGFISTGLQGYPPAAASQRRPPALLPAGEDADTADKTVSRADQTVAAPPRHPRRSSTSDISSNTSNTSKSIYARRAAPVPRTKNQEPSTVRQSKPLGRLIPEFALPPGGGPAPSSSISRFHVRGGAIS